MAKHAASLARLGNRFALLGTAEVAAGAVLGSDTILYSGFHNLADGPIFHAREHAHEADTQHRHIRANRLRRIAASAMLLFGLGLGARELDADSTKPDGVGILEGLAVAETAVNVVALASIAKNRNTSGAHSDAKLHLAIDAGGSAFTLVGVFGANYNPQFDQFGAVGHAVLLSAAAAMTLYHTRGRQEPDHDCHPDHSPHL